MSNVGKAAVVIMIMNLAGRLLGFVRETVIAQRFGATSQTDAYLVAYTLPYFLQAVLGMALISAIVPVITKYLVRGEKDEAWKIGSISLNWMTLIMAGFSLAGIVGARLLVNLTAPGFDTATADLAVTLTVIMFPSLVFMGAAMLITGILNANRSFGVPAFAPGFTSLVIIFSVIFFGRWGVRFLAWGTLAGMLGALLIQLPSLRRTGFRYTWNWDFSHPEVKGIFQNLFPIFLGTAVNQIYLAINRYFASGLAEGSISALNYAGKLMNLPLGVFVLAVSSAIFPTLSEQAVNNDRAALGLTLNRGLRMVLLVTLPAAAGLMALDTPIVRLLFERGAFDAAATRMTAEALFYFCIGMFAMSANMVITRAYYALGDVITPLWLGLLSILVNIAASASLIGPMAHSGLALANTAAAVFNTLAMHVLLKRHLPRLYSGALVVSAGKSLAASVLTAVAAYGTFSCLNSHINIDTFSRLAAGVFLAITAGVIVYVIGILLLREKEATRLLGTLLDRMGIQRGKSL